MLFGRQKTCAHEEARDKTDKRNNDEIFFELYVYIEIPRPDYEGLYDPDFFDDSLEALCLFMEEKAPGAILSGSREYNNPDLYRSMRELVSRKNGKLMSMTVVEVDWEEIKELMDNGADISEVCSILDMDEDEVWDGLSSLEEWEDEDE